MNTHTKRRTRAGATLDTGRERHEQPTTGATTPSHNTHGSRAPTAESCMHICARATRGYLSLLCQDFFLFQTNLFQCTPSVSKTDRGRASLIDCVQMSEALKAAADPAGRSLEPNHAISFSWLGRCDHLSLLDGEVSLDRCSTVRLNLALELACGGACVVDPIALVLFKV